MQLKLWTALKKIDKINYNLFYHSKQPYIVFLLKSDEFSYRCTVN